MGNKSECLCCQNNVPKNGPRICPICNHVFKGNGWDGIDAHWKAKHTDVMPYEEFWSSLCSEHKSKPSNSEASQEQKLLDIHRQLFGFLLEQDIPFYPRKQAYKDRSVENGYFFRGGDDYAQTTFWTGDCPNAHIYSIAFVVKDDSSSYLEITAQNSDEEERVYLAGIRDCVGGFNESLKKDRQWRLNFEGKDFLLHFQHVMDMIRPEIDKYLGDHPNEKFKPLNMAGCKKYINNVSMVFHGMNEQRIARLCWNTNNWGSPSGVEGKSRNKKSYEYLYGFGHEEWLFDMAKLVDGYHYAFIQPIGSKGRNTYAGQTFDISFYSIEDKTRKRFWIGDVRNVEVVDKGESERIHAIYVQKGWLDEMVQQLKAVGAEHEIFENFAPTSFVTIRFRSSDLNLLDTPKEFSKNDPAVTSDYYNLKRKVVDPRFHSGTFVFSPGHKRKKKTATITHRSKQKSIELVHNRIQDYMYDQLVLEHGADYVGTEQETGYGGSVDLAVKLGESEKFDFYEIKTSIGVRACIRDALSQLLEYAFYSKGDVAERLIIVSQNAITEESQTYLEFLRKKFGLPVYYQRFNLDAGMLDSELN